VHDKVGGLGVIGHEMDGVIVLSVHTGMHHEDAGFYGRAFTRFEDHRTDGQIGRSAPLQYLDIWILFESQQSIAVV
jgi:hypothetical protein